MYTVHCTLYTESILVFFPGQVRSGSPEDEELLLHDFKTLKFFLSATRGPPPDQLLGAEGDEEEVEEEGHMDMFDSSPVFNARPATMPSSHNLTYYLLVFAHKI